MGYNVPICLLFTIGSILMTLAVTASFRELKLSMLKNLSHFVRVTLIISIALDFSGLAFGLFYEGFFYDNLAHFLTSLVLVALAMELAHLRGVLPIASPIE